MVPGRRKTSSPYPTRVYQKHGALYYVEASGKWVRIGPADMPLPAVFRWVARHLEAVPLGTLAEVFSRYEREVLPTKSKASQKSQRLELARLKAVFGEMKAEDVQPADCWTYYTRRGSGSAAHHEVRLLSHVYTWAMRWGVAKTNPARGLGLKTPKARTRYVTDEEFVAVRDMASPMLGFAMDLALLTALRQGDILALERRNLMDDGLVVRTGKTDKGLKFLWSAELRATVDACLREKPQMRRALICRKDGKPMTSSGFQTLWQRLMAQAVNAGVERFTFHDLRAKSISDADSLAEGQLRAGHADPRVTARVYRRLPEVVTTLAILDTSKISASTASVGNRK